MASSCHDHHNNNQEHIVVLPSKTNKHPSSFVGATSSPQSPSFKSFNRKQSWNEQDMKHNLQNWLLQTEKDKESGFTEIKEIKPWHICNHPGSWHRSAVSSSLRGAVISPGACRHQRYQRIFCWQLCALMTWIIILLVQRLLLNQNIQKKVSGFSWIAED